MFCNLRPLRLLAVLLLCLVASAALAGSQHVLWRRVIAADPKSDELISGALLNSAGDLVIQLRVLYGPIGKPTSEATRFVRVKNNGAIEWLGFLPLNDEGGLLAEANAGGWFSATAVPDADSPIADLVVRRRSSSGELLDSVLWDGPAHAKDVPHAVAADGNGNLIVAGESNGFPAVWKFDDGANLVWSDIYPHPGAFTHLVMDAGGRAIAAGTLTQAQDGFLVVVHEADGDLDWADEYQHAVHPREVVTALTVLPGGEICVSGTSADAGHLPPGTNTVRYLTHGQVRWRRRGQRLRFDHGLEPARRPVPTGEVQPRRGASLVDAPDLCGRCAAGDRQPAVRSKAWSVDGVSLQYSWEKALYAHHLRSERCRAARADPVSGRTRPAGGPRPEWSHHRFGKPVPGEDAETRSRGDQVAAVHVL
jgi:hypothetical protein